MKSAQDKSFLAFNMEYTIQLRVLFSEFCPTYMYIARVRPHTASTSVRKVQHCRQINKWVNKQKTKQNKTKTNQNTQKTKQQQ